MQAVKKQSTMDVHPQKRTFRIQWAHSYLHLQIVYELVSSINQEQITKVASKSKQLAASLKRPIHWQFPAGYSSGQYDQQDCSVLVAKNQDGSLPTIQSSHTRPPSKHTLQKRSAAIRALGSGDSPIPIAEKPSPIV
jgi:hypothetical protein